MEITKPLIIFLALSSFAHADEYNIPSPDQRDEKSPPCMTGVIKKINHNILLIQTENSQIISILLSETTSMFTVYGGIIFKRNLQPSLSVKVWYRGKNCINPITPITAEAIMFASKEPGESWH